jgi:F-type H+-transporting ATPase subunit b
MSMRAAALIGIVFVALLFSAGPLFAAEDEPPKIEIFKPAIELTVWSIVVFLILFLVLRKFAWKPIAQGLDKREQSIARDRLEADKARQEARRISEELDREKAHANDEIRRMFDEARASAEALRGEYEAEAKATLALERERQQRDLEIERAQAMKETLDQNARLAALLSAKVIKKKLSEEDHRALLNEALKEFRAAASARVSDIQSARA